MDLNVMKNNIWNIVLTTIATGLLGILGYLLLNLVSLQTTQHTIKATVFTKEDSAILRQQLTDVMNDIDTRIQLIERDISWIKPGGGVPIMKQFDDIGSLVPEGGGDGASFAPIPMPDPPSPEQQQQQQIPRYDLRKGK